MPSLSLSSKRILAPKPSPLAGTSRAMFLALATALGFFAASVAQALEPIPEVQTKDGRVYPANLQLSIGQLTSDQAVAVVLT